MISVLVMLDVLCCRLAQNEGGNQPVGSTSRRVLIVETYCSMMSLVAAPATADNASNARLGCSCLNVSQKGASKGRHLWHPLVRAHVHHPDLKNETKPAHAGSEQ